MYVAHLLARRPEDDFALFAYNQGKAEDYGAEIKAEVLNHPRFSQIFPDFRWGIDEASKKQTAEGGNLYLVGRGGTINGRGFHRGIIDDPIKDSDEARRPLIRNKLWSWFNSDVWTRRHNDGCNLGIIMTRWHADDLVGRLTDPSNPYYNKLVAEQFHVINIPALALDDGSDPLGREPGEALWPEKHGRPGLLVKKAADPGAFASLQQGNPVPEGGVLIKEADIFEYDQLELDAKKGTFRHYITADLATGTQVHHDRSVILPGGVADNGVIYVLPDIFWGRKNANGLVEELVRLMRAYKPLMTYPEKGSIWNTMEPFVNKRMRELNVYFPLRPVWPTGKGDKETGSSAKVERITSAHARMQAGLIKFPSFAPWWADAKTEILQFPNAPFDDFVDALALVGLQVDHLIQSGGVNKKPVVERGTLGWLLKQGQQNGGSTGWITQR